MASMGDIEIKGGGTPIQSLVGNPNSGQQRQQQHQPVQQHQQPLQQHQQPVQSLQQPVQSLQQLQYRQQQQYPSHLRQEYLPESNDNRYVRNNSKRSEGKKSSDKSVSDNFKNITGVDWYMLISVIILFILFGNSLIYNSQSKFLPVDLRIGNPPLILVILNAVIVGILYLIIARIVPK